MSQELPVDSRAMQVSIEYETKIIILISGLLNYQIPTFWVENQALPHAFHYNWM